MQQSLKLTMQTFWSSSFIRVMPAVQVKYGAHPPATQEPAANDLHEPKAATIPLHSV